MTLLLEPRWKSYVVTTTAPILTPQQCDEVIKTGQALPQEEGRVFVGPEVLGKQRKEGANTKKRIAKISWIPFEAARPMYSIIERWMLNTNLNHFGFDGMTINEEAQYTEYPKGGFYEWHVDIHSDMSSMPPVRKISMTLLLSDPKDFKGGDLRLMHSKKNISLKRGHAIFFASFFPHCVMPVIKGNRKSLVMWFGGTPFK